jgi:hypothetical protein
MLREIPFSIACHHREEAMQTTDITPCGRIPCAKGGDISATLIKNVITCKTMERQTRTVSFFRESPIRLRLARRGGNMRGCNTIGRKGNKSSSCVRQIPLLTCWIKVHPSRHAIDDPLRLTPPKNKKTPHLFKRRAVPSIASNAVLSYLVTLSGIHDKRFH